MRISCLVLPIYSWREGRGIWQRVERLGFHAGYTYDHIAFKGFADGPWYAAMPTLVAAAGCTERLRLGTMVASPNFRHPVPFAKDLLTLDDISGGRLVVGLGTGSPDLDAGVLGGPAPSPSVRAERFAEFVPLLDRLLREPVTTEHGAFYRADAARMIPGCVQRPRPPFVVDATGPTGMRLAAGYGQGWVGCPSADDAAAATPMIARLLRRLDEACAAVGRDATTLERVVLSGFSPDDPLASPGAFDDVVGRYGELGITELIVHWPVPGSRFDNDPAVLDHIGTLLGGR